MRRLFNSPAIMKTVLFCGAVLAGWASRAFLPAHTTQPPAAPCLTSPTPDANTLALADPIRSRVMIADALVDSGADQFRKVKGSHCLIW